MPTLYCNQATCEKLEFTVFEKLHKDEHLLVYQKESKYKGIMMVSQPLATSKFQSLVQPKVKATEFSLKQISFLWLTANIIDKNLLFGKELKTWQSR